MAPPHDPVSRRLRISWTLAGHGWADCVVETNVARAELTASCISSAPEDLLTAVARLAVGATEARVQFEAEPTAFRWIFSREGEPVSQRLLELPQGRNHDNAGTELWSGELSIDRLSRALIRCFDEVAMVYGDHGYRAEWGEHFPLCELEALRRVWQARRSSDGSQGRPPRGAHR